jgi:hypothetical protein
LLGTAGADDFGGVEVGGVVFGEDLSFGHGGLEIQACSGVSEMRRRQVENEV